MPEGMEILHSCDVPLCVNELHLSADSHQRNMAEAVARDRTARGERSPHAVLTEAVVRSIRRSMQPVRASATCRLRPATGTRPSAPSCAVEPGSTSHDRARLEAWPRPPPPPLSRITRRRLVLQNYWRWWSLVASGLVDVHVLDLGDELWTSTTCSRGWSASGRTGAGHWSCTCWTIAARRPPTCSAVARATTIT